MGTAFFNLIVGGLTIAAGAAGYSFPGTQGPTVLFILGAVILAIGAYQLVKSRR